MLTVRMSCRKLYITAMTSPSIDACTSVFAHSGAIGCRAPLTCAPCFELVSSTIPIWAMLHYKEHKAWDRFLFSLLWLSYAVFKHALTAWESSPQTNTWLSEIRESMYDPLVCLMIVLFDILFNHLYLRRYTFLLPPNALDRHGPAHWANLLTRRFQGLRGEVSKGFLFWWARGGKQSLTYTARSLTDWGVLSGQKLSW